MEPDTHPDRQKTRFILLLIGGAGIAVTILSSSPAVGLALGLLCALLFPTAKHLIPSALSKYLLQAAVVLLGFGMNIFTVLTIGAHSVWITLITILATILLGWALGKALRVDSDLTLLLSSGTAICGGSAIAAVSPAIGASRRNTAVAMAVVFLLNALGLLIFPPLGSLMGLDQRQFGIWSALAIHDTSSVVGAAAVYGLLATSVATTVKLTRALWILPLSLGLAAVRRTSTRSRVPWFLIGFLAAATLASMLPGQKQLWSMLTTLGKRLMVTTLFLIGLGLTLRDIRAVGLRPLLLALLLWLVVTIGVLLLIHGGYFSMITIPQQ